MYSYQNNCTFQCFIADEEKKTKKRKWGWNKATSLNADEQLVMKCLPGTVPHTHITNTHTVVHWGALNIQIQWWSPASRLSLPEGPMPVFFRRPSLRGHVKWLKGTTAPAQSVWGSWWSSKKNNNNNMPNAAETRRAGSGMGTGKKKKKKKKKKRIITHSSSCWVNTAKRREEGECGGTKWDCATDNLVRLCYIMSRYLDYCIKWTCVYL